MLKDGSRGEECENWKKDQLTFNVEPVFYAHRGALGLRLRGEGSNDLRETHRGSKK